ncbi:hypothetical protein GQX73_g6484 [Xylaria multiplex]|uniref:Heterokaryon incompatibility domain-containing protein n=1 Tax=Xylaria multiplex TaxID=323545 RepID=A0A7C8IM35_9PEZI|nr:hypothetical protein GQX73_g6484 [Xylaria multiplex]
MVTAVYPSKSKTPFWKRLVVRVFKPGLSPQRSATVPATVPATVSVSSHLAIGQISSHNLLEEWQSIKGKDEWTQQTLVLNNPQREPLAYTNLLTELFQAEAAQSRRQRKELTLNQLRQKAALFAACQRLAFAIGAPVLGQLSPFTNSVRPPYNASINPGFWIKDQTGEIKPRFLWDVVRKQTVGTGRFEHCPEFVFISHTWGNNIDTFHDWVEVSGVPWKVPHITTFNIIELPNKLAGTPWKYVWIDLFTVPQGPEDEEGIRIQANEIHHQPTFLRQAKCAIAWFSDIPKWSLMPGVMQFLGLEIFESTVALEHDDVEKIKRAKTDILGNLAGTLEIVDDPGDMEESGNDIYANGWFRSPWTLQECCVRPDMILADANFDFLTATTGYPVAINDIAAVLVAMNSLPSMRGVKSLPQAARLALMVFQDVGLDHLVSIKSLAINIDDKGQYKLEPREQVTEGERNFFDQTLNSNKASDLIKRNGIFRVNQITSAQNESIYPS